MLWLICPNRFDHIAGQSRSTDCLSHTEKSPPLIGWPRLSDYRQSPAIIFLHKISNWTILQPIFHLIPPIHWAMGGKHRKYTNFKFIMRSSNWTKPQNMLLVQSLYNMLFKLYIIKVKFIQSAIKDFEKSEGNYSKC